MKSVVCALLAVIAFGQLNASTIHKRAVDKLTITPCSADSILTINEVNVNPFPAVIPGTLGVTVKGSLNVDMPKLYIKADIAKIFFGGRTRTRIPCISGYGSCVYDICEFTKAVTTCPPEMIKYNIPCQCPFRKFNLGNFQESFTIGALPSLLDWLKNGDYEARAEILATPDGKPLACYDIKASVTSSAVDCTNILKKFTPACRSATNPIGK